MIKFFFVCQRAARLKSNPTPKTTAKASTASSIQPLMKRWSATQKGADKMQEVDVMTEKEQATSMIAKYMDLLRIEKAENRDREIKNQLRETKAMLEALGVVVEDLVIE